MIALMVYYSQGIFVSLARRKHGIAAPKTTGNEAFENVFRVHYNTLENLPIFLTSLWFFALLVSPYVAGWLGLAWSVGRIGYMYGYYKSAQTRHSYGSVISYLALLPLIAGSFWGIISGLIR
jgi:glutathione S-transferase